MRSNPVTAASFVASLTVVGCVISAVELVDRPGATSSSTGGFGGSGGGGAAGNGGQGGTPECASAKWPSPPNSEDPPMGGDVDLVFAVRSIDIGESQPDLASVGPKIGYDLDDHCTGLGDSSSCVVPSGQEPYGDKDGPGGIDNRTAKLFASAKTFNASISSANYSKGAEDGSWTLLIRLWNYNGQKNDGKVSVALYPSPGFTAESCAPSDAAPTWMGTDLWTVDSNALGSSDTGPGSDGGDGICGMKGTPGYSFDQPKYIDENAYVSDGVFVANLPQAALTVSNFKAGTTIKLTAGFITGRIVEDAGVMRIEDGVFTGRWKASDMFLAFAAGLTEGSSLCTNDPVYVLVRNAICAARDIAGTLGGPTTPCDAVSLALSFKAHSAKLGAVIEAPVPSTMCPPDKSPEFDSCP